jgi:hypothetical protein
MGELSVTKAPVSRRSLTLLSVPQPPRLLRSAASLKESDSRRSLANLLNAGQLARPEGCHGADDQTAGIRITAPKAIWPRSCQNAFLGVVDFRENCWLVYRTLIGLARVNIGGLLDTHQDYQRVNSA